MNKKAIAILGAIFLLIVGTLGFLIYSKYSNKSTTTGTQGSNGTNPTPTVTSTPQASTTPVVTPTPVSSAGYIKLTADNVVSPALFFTDKGLTYFDASGNIYTNKIDNTDGQLALTEKTQLPIPPKNNFTKAYWSPATQDFIAQYTDSANNTALSYFKYIKGGGGSYTDLPPQIKSIDWSPDGSQIYYVWLDNGKASLSVGSPDAKSYKTLTPLWETDNEIHVAPDGSQILFFQTNNVGPNNKINSVSSDGKVFKGLIKLGQNYGVLWSPDSQKFLFARRDPVSQAYQLWVYNLQTEANVNLGLIGTVDKAVWDGASTFVYASVADSGAQNSSSDSIYRININTLEKKPYPSDPQNPIDGRNLMITSTGDKLFFKNAKDGGLYYLDLTQ